MSGQNRFIVDTPYGRFGTKANDAHFALVFKSRNPSAKADVVWLKTQDLIDYQQRRLARLGFVILGNYKATEQIDDYLGRRTPVATGE